MGTIIVADDDPLVRRTICDILTAKGAKVLEAADGEEAMRLALIGTPDILLIDLVMPKMDGLETIKRLRAERPALKIIALSGGGRNRYLDILDLADRLGANAVLAKPFAPKQLLALIAQQLASDTTWAVDAD